MTRDDLFNVSTRRRVFVQRLMFSQTNASIVRDLASAIGRVAPTAHVLVISNPVNSTVPIVASTLAKAGVYNPSRVFGVTTLDVVRAARFTAGIAGVQPNDTPITVIGGHSGTTIVPLLSQSTYGKDIKGEEYDKLVYRIQFGGDEVVKAKDGAGSATLSMAYAGAKFTNALLRGLNGEKGVVTPTFVESPLFKEQGIDFFSSSVQLGVGVIWFVMVGWLTRWCRLTVSRRSTLLELCLQRRRNCWWRACLSSRRTSRRAGHSLRAHRFRCCTTQNTSCLNALDSLVSI